MKNKSLLGKQFNDLKVIKKDKVKNHRQYWKCLCKCGNITYVSTYNLTSKKIKTCGCIFKRINPKGEKHPNFGRKFPGLNSNKKNGMWKGDKVSYKTLHQWIRRHKTKTKLCEKCKIKKPYDLANISGKYKRDIKDFKWLCRSCHMLSDGRMNNLKQYRR